MPDADIHDGLDDDGNPIALASSARIETTVIGGIARPLLILTLTDGLVLEWFLTQEAMDELLANRHA
jgi:hypothetical protein